MSSNKLAYIAGAITHLGDESYLDWYERLGKILAEAGYDDYVPHRDIHTPDPCPPEEIHPRNREIILHADLIVAYVGRPSLGVGMALELAFQENVPVILLSEKDATVSEMVLHSPNVKEHIRFENPEEALVLLEETLKQAQL